MTHNESSGAWHTSSGSRQLYWPSLAVQSAAFFASPVAVYSATRASRELPR